MSGVLPVVRRWWWLLAIAAGAAALMGFLVSSRLPPTYEAEVRLLVGPLSGDRDTIRAAGDLTHTYAALATSEPVLEQAAQRLGLQADALKGKVRDVTASDVTRLLTIRVRDGDPSRAALIANAIAEQLAEETSRGGGLSTPEGKLRVIDAASSPDSTIGPSSALIVPLAAFAGLLGAFGLAVLVESLSTVVRSEEDLAAVAPLSMLGTVDGRRSLRSLDRPLVVPADPHSSMAAAYRLLATKIELSNGERPPRSLLVLDAQGGRSSGRLAANLAGVLAEGGNRVCLLDSSEAGEIAGFFGFERERAGQESVLRRGRPLRIGRTTFDRFRVHRSKLVIFRARALPEPLELQQAIETIEHLLTEAELVVLTAPSVDRSPNTLVWSRAAEATVLAAERNHTKRGQISPALGSLRVAGANVIGTVLCRDRLS